ncbi:hypothetical protein BKA59DRAFT_469230 [Fusarium tricinctum]|uniref:Secreted protein n=1 Tax=Fusarium tricinctum TaxID=61284 RepID=A0A8K0WGS4_9HYPO|nr:hypothetical protein BKA59DRAFT_469230 [Fusarium tricinctum]
MSLSNLLSTVCLLLQSTAVAAATILLKTVINVGLCNLRITASHIPNPSIVGPLVWLALVWLSSLSSKNNAQTGYNYRHRSAHGRITTDFFFLLRESGSLTASAHHRPQLSSTSLEVKFKSSSSITSQPETP